MIDELKGMIDLARADKWYEDDAKARAYNAALKAYHSYEKKEAPVKAEPKTKKKGK